MVDRDGLLRPAPQRQQLLNANHSRTQPWPRARLKIAFTASPSSSIEVGKDAIGAGTGGGWPRQTSRARMYSMVLLVGAHLLGYRSLQRLSERVGTET